MSNNIFVINPTRGAGIKSADRNLVRLKINLLIYIKKQYFSRVILKHYFNVKHYFRRLILKYFFSRLILKHYFGILILKHYYGILILKHFLADKY